MTDDLSLEPVPAHKERQDVSKPVDVDEAWRDLKRRFRLVWILLLASLPGVFLPAYLLSDLIPPNASMPVLGLIWMTAIARAGLRVADFACPRCGRAFFESWYFLKMFRDSCAHCYLPRGAVPSPGDPK